MCKSESILFPSKKIKLQFFADRGIPYVANTSASHLEEIPHKTWGKKPYWPKYCMDWKLAEGP